MPTVLVKKMNDKNLNSEFEVDNDEVIYEGIKRQGLDLPHGCLAGSCGACRIEITEGSKNLRPPGAVESDTIGHIKNNLAQKLHDPRFLEKEIRLSCRAKVQGPVTITQLD